MGESRAEDIVNTEELLILLQMLNGTKKMKLIAQKAIERLKRFTGTNATALSTTITPTQMTPNGCGSITCKIGWNTETYR